MKILLTNDDGIYADGLSVLYRELSKFADCLVVAPDTQKSSVGHGITLSYPVWAKKIHRDGKLFGYAISGTPADCVKFAVSVLLKQKPDIVVSGINLGDNDGCSVFYSGTVAGAREGALLGIPSMAVSLAAFVDPNYTFAAKCAAKIARQMKKNKIPKGTFLNVNVPNKPSRTIKGVKMTKQGLEPIHARFHKRNDPQENVYYWLSGKPAFGRNYDGSDTIALRHNYVTVTPIHVDSTDYVFLNELKKWKL
ncbi:MAG TPA: 5'/3'-nucleotidase SurE [Candidatus Omnitrophota bacterium]|nr:5'/3'-nucleotidase SurE [Candidatus Omnitrophota bacterium]